MHNHFSAGQARPEHSQVYSIGTTSRTEIHPSNHSHLIRISINASLSAPRQHPQSVDTPFNQQAFHPSVGLPP